MRIQDNDVIQSMCVVHDLSNYSQCASEDIFKGVKDCKSSECMCTHFKE